jgi:hypothetical protein
MYNDSKLKFWWHPLAILNTRFFIKKLHDNIFEFNFHFESKLILITVKWKRLDKINVYKLYNLQIFNGHKPHICGSWNITKQKKNEKKCNTYLLVGIYGSGLFLKKGYYYALIVQKCKKPHSLNKISFNFKNVLRGLRFDWCISISYTKKTSHKSSHPQP